MKTHALLGAIGLMAVLLATTSLYGQGSVQILPSGGIAPWDAVTMQITVSTPTSPAFLYEPTQLDITGHQITVDIFVDAGFLQMFDSVTDWVDLGVLPAGAWDYLVIGHAGANLGGGVGPFAADTFVVQGPGDFDLDGVTNLLDINDFVLAIVDWNAYAALYPEADILCIDPRQPSDGVINLLDIPEFVVMYTDVGGGVSGLVPEPAAMTLLTLGGFTVLRRPRAARP